MKVSRGSIKHVMTGMALLLMMFSTACGNSNTNGGNGEQSGNSGSSAVNSAPAASNSQKPAETVEITAWDKQHADDPLAAYWNQLFTEFEAKYPNIKVNHVEQVKGKEREQFMTAVAGDEQPDVYPAAYPTMELYIQQGIAADITNLWNGYADKDNYIPSSLTSATSGEKLYGFPRDMYTTGLYYNKKIFKDAGLDPNMPPKTWDDFIDDAKKTENASKGINGFDILGMDWADWHFEYYVWAAGGDLTEKNADGSAKLTFTSDAAVQALQFYKDLKWKHNVTQKNVVQSLDDNQKDFYTGHSAMIVGASGDLGTLVSKGMSMDDIGFAPLPSGPSGKAPAQVGGSYWVFNPKASKAELEAAFTYVSFLQSKENMQSFYQYQKDNGVIMNMLSIRSDIDVTQYIDGLPADIAANVSLAANNPHLEYFLKERLSPYLVKAIQQVLLDPKADPKQQLDAAQKLAQNEVVDKYNAELNK